MKTLLTITLLMGAFSLFAKGVPANNCEVFINQVQIKCEGAVYAGTCYVKMGIKSIPQLAQSEVTQIAAAVENQEFNKVIIGKRVAYDYFELSIPVKSYYPEVSYDNTVKIYARTNSGKTFFIPSSVSEVFYIDMNSFRDIRSELPQYQMTAINTQNGRFGSYYNFKNCY